MIIDINGKEVTNPDLEKGYIKEDVITIHHEAVEGSEEQSHIEIVKEYANGGKDVIKIIDAPYVEAKAAYDEEIEVERYVEYTEEELSVNAQKVAVHTLVNGVKELSNADKLAILLDGVDIKVDGKDVTEAESYPIKIGYKIEFEYDATNRVIIGKYVKDDTAVGTEENPIVYYDGCPLVDNAFYIKDGKRQVYMSGEWTEF